MKKLISISLALVLAGGLLLTDTEKAEAMNNESAALLTASIVLLGIPVVHAITHDHVRPAPVYAAPYPVQTTVVYTAPRYERHQRHDWERSHRHKRGWHKHRRGHDDGDHYRQRH
ncbi:MAG: hypothetical protein OEW04_15390 [Nitrospirota bacterium]|nr:hypothetical protein [Nitrospirota bacterium]